MRGVEWKGRRQYIVVFELDNIAVPVTSIMNLFQHGTIQRVAGNPIAAGLRVLENRPLNEQTALFHDKTCGCLAGD